MPKAFCASALLMCAVLSGCSSSKNFTASNSPTVSMQSADTPQGAVQSAASAASASTQLDPVTAQAIQEMNAQLSPGLALTAADVNYLQAQGVLQGNDQQTLTALVKQ